MTQAFCWSCHLSYMCQKQSAFQMSRMKSLQWTADQARWIFTFLFCLFSKTQNLSNAPQWQWQQFAKKHSDNGFLFQWHSEMYAQFNTHKQSAPWMDPQIFLLFFPSFIIIIIIACLIIVPEQWKGSQWPISLKIYYQTVSSCPMVWA